MEKLFIMPNALPPVNVRERRLVSGVAQCFDACLCPQGSFAQPPSPLGKGRAESERVAEGIGSRGRQATKYGCRELIWGKVSLTPSPTAVPWSAIWHHSSDTLILSGGNGPSSPLIYSRYIGFSDQLWGAYLLRPLYPQGSSPVY